MSPFSVSPPKKIMVEASVRDGALVSALRRNLPDAAFQVWDKVPQTTEFDPDRVEVIQYRGRFLRPCPGTRNYLCCGYQILHFGTQCSLDCSYCILQAYLQEPNLRLFGNTGDLLREVDEVLRRNPETLYRVGTGEFTDSLLLDLWTEFSRLVVPYFAGRPNAVLELKTKTPFVRNLEGLDHGGNTIVAWSLNAEAVCRREEPRAASLSRRLEAARRVADWGYRLAFHFDPMIVHPGWREGYLEVLHRLFDAVDPADVVWISLGAFRFMPSLKPVLQSRHPHTKIASGEFIRGLDGKMRYFRDIRVELYAPMVDAIRRIDPSLCVYLCMESPDIWRETFGFSPEDRGGLPKMLDRAVQDRMGIGTACRRSAGEQREDLSGREGVLDGIYSSGT